MVNITVQVMDMCVIVLVDILVLIVNKVSLYEAIHIMLHYQLIIVVTVYILPKIYNNLQTLQAISTPLLNLLVEQLVILFLVKESILRTVQYSGLIAIQFNLTKRMSLVADEE